MLRPGDPGSLDTGTLAIRYFLTHLTPSCATDAVCEVRVHDVDGTDFADWVKEHDIDTITLTGFMTNNCVLGTAEGAEPHGVDYCYQRRRGLP